MNEKVSVILLNYKGVEDTLECVRSLEKCSYDNFDIIIVENASPDDSYERLKEKFGDNPGVEPNKVILLKAEENGGFAKGNNIGIEYALENNADYIMILNNDTLVEPDFIEELLKPFKRDDAIGVTTGKIYYEEKRNTFWFAGGQFLENRFYGAHIGEGEEDRGQYDSGREITFSTGCLMMIKAEVLKKVGLLPEEYFMYYEDVDFCLKLREAGYKLWFAPRSKIYHKVSASTGGEASPFAIEWNTRNRILLMKKFKHRLSKSEYMKLNSFFYLSRVAVIGRYLVKGEKEKVKATFRGIRSSRQRSTPGA